MGPNSKIPSVICYDASGLVAAVGSETNPDTNPELLEVDGLSRVEWYSIHHTFCFFQALTRSTKGQIVSSSTSLGG